ncbi:MAG: phage tail tube protein [Candidatus Bathycorpusculaceae bacterium]
MARTSAYAYMKYGWESSFKDGATTRDKVFGRAQRITGLTRRENLEMLYELGAREPQYGAFRNFEGAASVEWVLSNPWWIKSVLGTYSVTGSSAPYTHTWQKANAPVTMGIEVGFQGEGGNVVRNLKGAVVTSVSLSGALNDVIRCRADVLYAEEATPTLGTAIVDSFDPFTSVHASLELPTGTVLAEVQSFDLTINNNSLFVWGLGSQYPAAVALQAFDVTGRFSITMKNATFLNYVRGKQSSIRFKVTNGLTGADERTIRFDGTDVYFGEHTVGFEPNALVIEELPFTIKNITATAINATASSP